MKTQELRIGDTVEILKDNADSAFVLEGDTGVVTRIKHQTEDPKWISPVTQKF